MLIPAASSNTIRKVARQEEPAMQHYRKEEALKMCLMPADKIRF